MKKEEPSLNIIHLSESVGKKQAIEAASEIAKGEIFVSMDSDCDMACDAVEKAVKIFNSDRKIGAISGHGRVRGAITGNALMKMQDVYIDASCRILKGMETSFCSVTCCAGSLSFFRREAVMPYMHDWAHDKFLGMENFKFATDRRLTAFILGTKESSGLEDSSKSDDSASNIMHNIPVLAHCKNGLDTTTSWSDSDTKNTNNKLRYAWKIVYSQSIKVNVGYLKHFQHL